MCYLFFYLDMFILMTKRKTCGDDYDDFPIDPSWYEKEM
jgi:hypothetical protein